MMDPHDETDDDQFDYHDPADCCHEDYEVNVEGRATCLICNARWWPTAKELDRYYGALQGDEML